MKKSLLLGLVRRTRSAAFMDLVLFGLMAASLAAQTGNGALKVTSFPSGAKVSIDGIDTGKTTPMSTNLSVGDHMVVVSIPNSGWNADSRQVTIVSGNNDLSVTLLPTLTAGPPGSQGLPGLQGIPGTNGTNGINGINGINVTSVTLPIGNANCPTGGSAFTSATGTTYACNGSVPELERWNLVGTTGEPAFGGWAGTYSDAGGTSATNAAFWASYRSTAFYKDPLGLVHLGGVAFANGIIACNVRQSGDAISLGAIFTLPSTYNPDYVTNFPCLVGDADSVATDVQAQRCEIATSGDITVPSIHSCTISSSHPNSLGQIWVVMLDGVNFRSGSSSGCSAASVLACTGQAAGAACTKSVQGVVTPGTCTACGSMATLACQ